jgi:prevent-host-death family protein
MPATPKGRSVSSTEFQNRAGLYLDRAAREPVVITKYNRPSRVLIDFDEYEGLRARARARPTRRALRTRDLPPEAVEALEAADFSHIDPGLDKLMDE